MNNQETQKCTRCKVVLKKEEFKLKRDGKRMSQCEECNEKITENRRAAILQRLIKGFQNIGLDYDYVKKNYKYCGGDKCPHYNYFKLCFSKTTKLPNHKIQCVCGHDIKENCYITENNDYNKIVVIGNCCIKKFIENKNRTCENCGKTHKNRTVNLCNDCKSLSKCDKCNSCLPTNYKQNICVSCMTCELCSKETKRIFEKKCYECFINRLCVDCDTPFRSEHNDKCIECRKIKCEDCDNRKINLLNRKCKECRQGKCYDCNKPINIKFFRCFHCLEKEKQKSKYVSVKSRINLDSDSEDEDEDECASFVSDSD